MGAIENFRAESDEHSIDRFLDNHNARLAGWKPGQPHPLESAAMHQRHKQLLSWYQHEREKQAANRYQQAIDQDFYDNLQWDEQDIQELAERGQAALVFNVTATTVDWIIGTEKRTRVDFKAYPRAEDDVQAADAKTKTLKYLSDVNKTAFARSLAFADSVKVGVGWVEDGARADPQEEVLFSRYESWRNMLWDSSGVERDGKDWRYLYRWKWLDLDIAEASWPDRRDKLRQAAVAANLFGNEDDEDFWYLGQRYQARDARGEVIGRRTYINDATQIDPRRSRVKLIEAWYRVPERCFICRGEVFNGEVFDKSNPKMVEAAMQNAIGLYDTIAMRVRCAIMTEGHLIAEMASPYRHNRFPFTPIWCYIRGRDRMPYGTIRRIRDPQEDLNKRSSKALFLLSTRGVVVDHDALEGTGLTWDDFRDEAARPDYLLTVKKGSRVEFNDNVQVGEEHLLLADRDERMIQNAGGVTDENLGRRTNATSGKAIQARQLQGSVVTAEIFDNERFAIQHQGETQLSLVEQYMTEPKVMRLIGAKRKLDWVRINEPELQPDGSVRYLNDVTASKADFIVDEQDYHQSVRQAMFETMTDLVGKLAAVNVEAALRIMRMALEFSDLPNKDEMASEIKDMLGIVDEEELERMTPEERQQYQQQVAMKQEAMELQRRGAAADVAEKEARSVKLGAEAEKIAAEAEMLRAEAQGLLAGEGGELGRERAKFDEKLRTIEERAAAAVDQAREQMEDLRAQVRDRKAEIDKKAETEVEVAKINAKAKLDEAQIVNQFKQTMDGLNAQLKDLASQVKEIAGRHEKLEKSSETDRTERKAREKVQSEAEDRKSKEKPAAPSVLVVGDAAQALGDTMKGVTEGLKGVVTEVKALRTENAAAGKKRGARTVSVMVRGKKYDATISDGNEGNEKGNK